MAYIDKYIQSADHARIPNPGTPPGSVSFLGATLHPLDRKLQNGDQTVLLTPRETLLVELLSAAENQVVAYDTLYNEILSRPFRGDTSNMRVLLAKLQASTAQVGLSLRDSLEVIPKSGYRYHHRPKESRPAA